MNTFCHRNTATPQRELTHSEERQENDCVCHVQASWLGSMRGRPGNLGTLGYAWRLATVIQGATRLGRGLGLLIPMPYSLSQSPKRPVGPSGPSLRLILHPQVDFLFSLIKHISLSVLSRLNSPKTR